MKTENKFIGLKEDLKKIWDSLEPDPKIGQLVEYLKTEVAAGNREITFYGYNQSVTDFIDKEDITYQKHCGRNENWLVITLDFK